MAPRQRVSRQSSERCESVDHYDQTTIVSFAYSGAFAHPLHWLHAVLYCPYLAQFYRSIQQAYRRRALCSAWTVVSQRHMCSFSILPGCQRLHYDVGRSIRTALSVHSTVANERCAEPVLIFHRTAACSANHLATYLSSKHSE